MDRFVDGKSKGLIEFSVREAKEGSIDWYLAQAHVPLMFVDLKAASLNAIAREWVEKEMPMRSIGSQFSSGADDQFFGPVTPGKSFDGFFFIDKTTRARPNATGMRSGQ